MGSFSLISNYKASCRGKSSVNILYKLDELEINYKKDDLTLLILEANELVFIFTSSIH